MIHPVNSKTVIITGGASGIGAATSALYNANGAKVVIADLENKRADADKLIQTLPYPSAAKFVPVNILDWAQMTDLFKTTKGHFDGIDIVVANAGIMESNSLWDMDKVDGNCDLLDSKEVSRVIDVNLKGTMNTLRLAMQAMKDRRGDQSHGSIVLVASTSGYFGGTGVGAYVASKHGVIGLLRASQAAAAKYGIRVNSVSPLFTPTHITSSYAEEWRKSGLEENKVEGVASAILQISVDESSRGSCVLVAGKFRREMETNRKDVTSKWLGEDATCMMEQAARFFDSIGGYPLPGEDKKLA